MTTPCACGCGQDAATIERLRREAEGVRRAWREDKVALYRVRALLFRHYTGSPGGDATPEHVREIDALADLYDEELAAELRAALEPQDSPQDAASAPEAPGHGEGAGNAADGRTAALARGMCASRGVDPDLTLNGKPMWEYMLPDAERILADPGPLLAALAEAGVLLQERGASRARYVAEWGEL